MSKQSYFKQFSLSLVHIFVLFDQLIGPGNDDNEGYTAFLKAPALLEPQHQIASFHFQDTRWWGSYTSTEKQSVYLAAPANRTI